MEKNIKNYIIQKNTRKRACIPIKTKPGVWDLCILYPSAGAKSKSILKNPYWNLRKNLLFSIWIGWIVFLKLGYWQESWLCSSLPTYTVINYLNSRFARLEVLFFSFSLISVLYSFQGDVNTREYRTKKFFFIMTKEEMLKKKLWLPVYLKHFKPHWSHQHSNITVYVLGQVLSKSQ